MAISSTRETTDFVDGLLEFCYTVLHKGTFSLNVGMGLRDFSEFSKVIRTIKEYRP